MHQDSKIASRYAQSLLGFALEQKKLEEIKDDMELIINTIDASRELALMLKSPIIKTDKKVKILGSIFSGKIGSITQNFVLLITKKKREGMLSDIAMAFANSYRAHQGVLLAEITTAVPLTDEGRVKAMAFIQKMSAKVELKEIVKPEIIGGFIIRVGDRQYDESVESRLHGLKRAFLNNTYSAEI